MKKIILLLFIFTTSISISKAQLVFTSGFTPLQLANFIMGQGDSVFNVSFTGDPTMISFFTAAGTNLGITNGVMLATGDVSYSIGPNSLQSAGTDMGLPGDSILDILADTSTLDACILEFDFVPQNAYFSFRYVFGSEEYPEYVCSEYNDVFAFYISGPGITGLRNMALIPATSTPVAINTINGGIIGANGSPGPHCGLANANFYVDNTNGTTIELDGFTIPMTAEISVQPLMTYHLRIMIADAVDHVFDSGVFLEQGSLTSSIGKLNINNDLFLFPNPVSNTINLAGEIAGAKINRVKIFDAVGKLIINEILNDIHQPIDVSSLRKGIYFAEFISIDQKVIYRKFAKE